MQPGHGQHIAVSPVAQSIASVPPLVLKTKALIIAIALELSANTVNSIRSTCPH